MIHFTVNGHIVAKLIYTATPVFALGFSLVLARLRLKYGNRVKYHLED